VASRITSFCFNFLVTCIYGDHRILGIKPALMFLGIGVASMSMTVITAVAHGEGKPVAPAIAVPVVGLNFSENPSDEEFLQANLFLQPLIPVGRSTREENRDLASALMAYQSAMRHGDLDAVEPILNFLAHHANSAWTAALQLDLGGIYRRTGHLSKALDVWLAAWLRSKNFVDPNGRAIGDAAVAYLSQFEAYLGRKEMLKELLEEVKTRPIRGSAAELVSESAGGLADMLTRPEVAFKCGPSALARILDAQGSAPLSQSRNVLDESQSTPNGLSLTTVRDISVKAGMNYQMAFRSEGSPVILPAVIHWKVGHYAAVLGRDSVGRYLVGDPTFGEDILVSPSTLAEEASGYFLVPPGKLPNGWRSVDAAEGDGVWGRGDTGANHDNGATGGQERHAYSCSQEGGCSTWNVEAMVVGLSLHDDPIGYTPPIGPSITFPMDYSHRDKQQPMQFAYTNFGNKWTTGWLSYVQDNAGCDGFYGSKVMGILNNQVIIGQSPNPDCVLLYRRGGGSEPYILGPPPYQTGPNGSIAQNSALGQFSQAVLTRLVDPVTFLPIAFWRTLPDGSVEKFEHEVGFGQYPQFFMTELDDAQGNAVKITYDASMRIVALTDSIGQVTTVCYSDSWQNPSTPCSKPPASGGPPSTLQVTQVVDPFGRSAYFGYDPLPLNGGGTGHLTSITDVLGITSTFSYSPGTDFISLLTTPYGTTHFAFTDVSVDTTVGSSRSVTIIDPLQRTSRVEFHQGDSNDKCTTTGAVGFAAKIDTQFITCEEIAGYIPQGMATVNKYLQFRNTFIWDRYQYQLAFGPASPSSCFTPYTCASIVHWLHTNDTNLLTAARGVESVKEPFETRVWFNYENQQNNGFAALSIPSVSVGSTNQPTSVGRVLDDGSTQLWQYAYNGYGKVTQITDPVGRQVTFTYATNGIDVLTASNTTPSLSLPDLLVTFADYNTQHEPQTRIATNGQITKFSYTTAGQIKTVTDPLQNTWTFNYVGSYLHDISGPPAPQILNLGFTYDTFGRIRTLTDPVRGSLTYSYDPANRLTQILYPDQSSEIFGYTLLDLTSATDRRQNTTQRYYDAGRELYKITEPGNRTTTIGYDPGGRVKTIQDPLGFTTGVTTTLGRDAEGRLASIQYPDGSGTYYAYDHASRLNVISPMGKDPLFYSTVYTYNKDNSLAQVRPPEGILSTLFAYDPAYRRLKGWASSSTGGAEFFSYYPITSPPTLNANQLSTDVTYVWDSVNPSSVAITKSTYSYDELDRVVGRTLTPAAFPNSLSESIAESWQYDSLGRVILNSNALDQFTYQYWDASARLKSRTSVAGPQISASYYPTQQDGLLHTLDYEAPGQTSFQFGYQYDGNHNVSEFIETVGGQANSFAYSYDPYNQLLQPAPEPGQLDRIFSYEYDQNGNRKNSGFFTPLPLTTTQVQYNGSNEITTATTSNLVGGQQTTTVGNYDTDGDLSSNGGPTYAYDSLDRLISVTNGNKVSTFNYDGIGRLTQIVDFVSGKVTRNRSYSWCRNGPCVEFDNTVENPITAIPSLTMPIADKIYFNQGMLDYSHPGFLSPGRYYYITDLLGSTRALASTFSTSSSIVSRYEYDPYGNQTSIGGVGEDSDFGFAGYFHHKATGLDFALSRVYSAQLGRWLTRDPIGNAVAFSAAGAFNATDLNLYAYAGNNPTSQRDPSGTCPECLTAAAGAVIGAAGYGITYAATAPTNLSAKQFISGLFSAWGQGAFIGGLAGTGAYFGAKAMPWALQVVGPGVGTLIENEAGSFNCAPNGAEVATLEEEATDVTTHLHHIFPQQFRSDFEGVGINIDRYTIPLDPQRHAEIHDVERYNDQWQGFLEGGRVTGNGAIGFAVEILNDLGLAGPEYPVVPYKR
jgi:RHS repeat-associated protein